MKLRLVLGQGWPTCGSRAACGSFSHAVFLLSAAPRSVIMLRLATHEVHYRVIISLLENYDEALTSGGGHLFVLSSRLSS